MWLSYGGQGQYIWQSAGMVTRVDQGMHTERQDAEQQVSPLLKPRMPCLGVIYQARRQMSWETAATPTNDCISACLSPLVFSHRQNSFGSQFMLLFASSCQGTERDEASERVCDLFLTRANFSSRGVPFEQFALRLPYRKRLRRRQYFSSVPDTLGSPLSKSNNPMLG